MPGKAGRRGSSYAEWWTSPGLCPEPASVAGLRELSCTSNCASRAVERAASVRSVRFSPPDSTWLIRPGRRPCGYHPVTTNGRKYSVADLPALALRLTAEAENELDLMLARVYRLGYHRLLIYPFRPEPAVRARPAPGGRSAGREPTPS